MANWFRHDADARHDARIIKLRAEFGYEAYGLYWGIVEMMTDAENCAIDHDINVLQVGLGICLANARLLLEQTIETCLELGLFQLTENGLLYSASLRSRLQKYNQIRRKRAESGKKGGEAKALANATVLLKQNAGNKNKNKNIYTSYEVYKHLPPELDTDDFKNAWAAFAEMRKKIKAPFTDRAQQLLLKDLLKFSPADAVKSLEQSTKNGWRGVFPPREDSGQQLPFRAQDAKLKAEREARAVEVKNALLDDLDRRRSETAQRRVGKSSPQSLGAILPNLLPVAK